MTIHIAFIISLGIFLYVIGIVAIDSTEKYKPKRLLKANTVFIGIKTKLIEESSTNLLIDLSSCADFDKKCIAIMKGSMVTKNPNPKEYTTAPKSE